MRIKTAHIALLLSILALVASLFNAVQVSRNDNSALIEALMAQNQNLQDQIDALSVQSGETVQTELSATLSAVGWPDGRGADVTLILDHVPADDALLRVMAGSTVLAEVPCYWDGTACTATAGIEAGNGYTYSLIVGSEARTLASPENPVYPELVNLADALNAYCNLVVDEWEVRDNVLTLDTCFAHIQYPQLGSGALTCVQATLVLKHGDEPISQVSVTDLLQAATGGCEGQIDSAAFTLPELEEGEQVDLWLEATLSDGQVLTTCAATWYAMRSGFSMAAG